MPKQKKEEPIEEQVILPEEEALAEAVPMPEPPAEEPAPPDALTLAQNEMAQLQDQFLRLAAEYDNYRKRTAKELDARYTDAKAFTLAALLPAFDNLERAAVAENASREDLVKGVELTLKQLDEIFGTLGLARIGQPGEPFDPTLHNAVMHVEDESLPENVVAQVLQKGYQCGDKVIRHAMVSVAN